MHRYPFRVVLLVVAFLLLSATGWAFTTMFEGFPVVNLIVNGKSVTGDVPAIIMNGRTLLPVRAVADALGTKAEWDPDTRTVTLTAIPPKLTPAATFGDGAHMVGTDIQPGTYRAFPTGSFSCYWARLKDFTGGMGSTLANDNVSPGDSAIVTIISSDAGFESKRCGTWTKIK